MPTLDDAHEGTGTDATAPAPPLGDETDGRRRRSQRSRAAIAHAMLELLREGDIAPSSATIAERAGVTQRTLFNQFGDMASLIRTVLALQVERVVELLPDAGTGTAGERLDRFTDQLAELLEDTMHVRWAVVIERDPTPELAEAAKAAHALVWERFERGFAAELAALDEDRLQAVAEVVDVLADPAAWRLRRVHHGRSFEAARAAVRRILADLLHIDA